MSEVMRVQWLVGSVDMPRLSGMFVRGEGGIWREVMTDMVERDGRGREVRREPCLSTVGIALAGSESLPSPCSLVALQAHVASSATGRWREQEEPKSLMGRLIASLTALLRSARNPRNHNA